MSESPSVTVIAGPNGAGKSTSAAKLLAGRVDLEAFVNADEIAKGLTGFATEKSAIAAGRIMLDRVKDLALHRETFAFETTLASRTFAPWIADLVKTGYEFHLVYLTLPSPDLSIARVAGRVQDGGHFVPDQDVRRRFEGGLWSFFTLYRPIANTWKMYDNASRRLQLIACGTFAGTVTIADRTRWNDLKRSYGT